MLRRVSGYRVEHIKKPDYEQNTQGLIHFKNTNS